MMRVALLAFVCAVAAVPASAFYRSPRNVSRACTGACRTASKHARMLEVMGRKEIEHAACVAANKCPTLAPAMSSVTCHNGMAGEYPCSGIDMQSFVPIKELGSTLDASDIWGWTDPKSGMEVAIINMMDGTSFVDVTKPTAPVVLGFLPTHRKAGTPVIWRDVKVYQDHAYIVSESKDHGMQVFDLTTLRGLSATTDGAVRQFSETAHYAEFGSCHNIVINEDTGFAYAVGTKTCRGGLHIVDISEPTEPVFSSCYEEDGYTHDAQCVVYSGPDDRFHEHEICFAYNEDTLTIVDVTDKDNLRMLARHTYDDAQYTHQGWLNDAQSHLLLNDELDEVDGKSPFTRTLVWSVEKLDEPKWIDTFFSSEKSVDHNLYIKGNKAYLSNYCAGLRIYDVTDITSGTVKDIAHFDVNPDCATTNFQGTWSNYPYFESGTIIVSSIERGLFVLKLQDDVVAQM